MNAERILPDLLDSCGAVALFGAAGWAAWIGAVAATRPPSSESSARAPRIDLDANEDSVSARWCAAFVLTTWGLSAAFFPLVSLERFRIEVALPLAVLVAGVLHRTLDGRAASRMLARDLAALREIAVSLGARARRTSGDARDGLSRLDLALFAAVAFLAFVRLVRGLVAPPLVTDALTYHLLRAGRWASTGGWAAERGPDVWGYYEFHPVAGDALWAWAMLPFSSDAVVGLASALTWLALGLSTYAAARALGGLGAPIPPADRWWAPPPPRPSPT